MKGKTNSKRGKISLGLYSFLLSLANLLIFHWPWLKYIAGNVTEGFNGHVIIVCMALLMLSANFFAFYLILWLGRKVGKVLGALSFILNAICLYFINTYNVILDEGMMGNVFNTDYAEAASYWSWTGLGYIVFAGVLPAVLMFLPEVDYGSVKRFFANIGAALGIMLAIAFGNMSNWPWIDKHSTTLGALLMPWSSIVNSIRYADHVRERNRVAELLPDAEVSGSDRSTVIVIIGESSRRDHFSLYGYPRQTNPQLSRRKDIKAYMAESAATYTTEGVKAILDHKPTSDLYEILPNYLSRSGVEVIWRSSNWGEPPLSVIEHQTIEEIASDHGMEGHEALLDSTLLVGLKERIDSSSACKTAVFLHTSTSHGPTYYLKYPASYERFTPAAREVEMSRCPHDELVNAYDNSILYTDAIIDAAIRLASELKDRKTCVIFVSDHGESLGENGLYMHGLPMSMAPAEQYEIPFIVWCSDGPDTFKDIDMVSQYYVFHSVMHFLGVKTPVYNEQFDIFR